MQQFNILLLKLQPTTHKEGSKSFIYTEQNSKLLRSVPEMPKINTKIFVNCEQIYMRQI